MKSIGLIIASISALCLLLALNMSTTVTTGERTFGNFTVPSMTVNNLGLMQDKQNYIIVSAVFLILGVGIFLIAPKNDSKESMKHDESDHIPNEEKIGQYVKNTQINSSERNIDNDAYKLYLIEKYKIVKNEVLNQFVLNSKIYETIGDVLNTAHNIELQESMEAEEKLRMSSEKIAKNISVLSDQAKSYLEVILRNGYKLEETLIKNNSLIWIFQAKSNGSRFEINSIEELRSLASNFK